MRQSKMGMRPSANTIDKLKKSRQRRTEREAKRVYITPKGEYFSPTKAAQDNGISLTSVYRWCKMQKDGYNLIEMD